jgi:hypothetical protein
MLVDQSAWIPPVLGNNHNTCERCRRMLATKKIITPGHARFGEPYLLVSFDLIILWTIPSFYVVNSVLFAAQSGGISSTITQNQSHYPLHLSQHHPQCTVHITPT